MIPKWQIPLIEKFCEAAAEQEVKSDDPMKQLELLGNLIAEDKDRSTGFWKLRNYTSKSQASFLGRCQSVLQKFEEKRAQDAIGLVERRISLLVRFRGCLGYELFENTLYTIEKVYAHTQNLHEMLVRTSLNITKMTDILNNVDGVESVKVRPASLFGKIIL